ncbi:MlaD family protein [Nocardia rhamnosiphila]|uniref:MlaD family protein n=1 Tax=Nocardia rhamnosiphila TaxID=426716 RepID=UPI0004C35A1C|nr:MCE family protein [Nocardia rhamnosiphila]
MLFDKDGRGPSLFSLVLRGILLIALAVLFVGGVLMKSAGRFDSRAEVVALLDQVGDGLPPRSDVKYQGVLVGTVADVAPPVDGGPTRVRLELDPHHLADIPRTVTVRVVPSNLFAVSSVQLVDNGPAPGLVPGTEIVQDSSLSTIQFQTALTKLRDIVAASARIGSSDTVGVLAAVAGATDRRGGDIVRAGAQLDRITRELSALIAPPGQPSTLTALADSVRGLANTAPELLDALNHAIAPLRTAVEQEDRLIALLTAGGQTLTRIGNGFDNHTDQLVTITDQFTPVLEVFAAGGPAFTPIVGRIKRLSDIWFAEFWNEQTQIGTGKFQIRLSPDTPYTRADCPRYGELAGPSCATAPVEPTVAPLPPVLDPRSMPRPALPPEVMAVIDRVLRGDGNAAELVLSHLLTNGPPPAGGAR